MARLTAEQYAAQLRYLRYQDGLRLPNSGLGERDQFALDAHERAEAEEKRNELLLRQIDRLPLCSGCRDKQRDANGGLRCPACERDELRRRLAAAEAYLKALRSKTLCPVCRDGYPCAQHDRNPPAKEEG